MKHFPLIGGLGLLVIFLFLLLLIRPATPVPDRLAYEHQLRETYRNMKSLMPPKPEPGRPKVGFPEKAALQNYILTRDPATGRVPAERLYNAWQETIKLQHQQAKSTNAIIQWQNIGSDMGGRMRCLLWDPNDPNHKKVWGGSVTGGLWYNNDITNQNSSWVAVNDFWENLSISSITYDPNNTQTLYAGTGEAQTAIIVYRESSGRGAGIFKSTDGGLSWSLLPSTHDFAYVTDIRVRNESGQSVVYAAVVSGYYKGMVHTSQPDDGLYRSTDGGQSWTQVLPQIPGESRSYSVADLDISADGSRIFAGTMRNADGKGGAVILYSDAGTAGSWTVFDQYNISISNSTTQFTKPGRIMLLTAPSNANILYALVSAGYNAGFDFYEGKYILKSVNKGQSWSEISYPPDYNGRNWANLAWHAFTGVVDPANPNTLWVGGLDVHRSTNGGSSWTLLSDWAQMYNQGGPDYIHADQHCMAYRPGSSTELIFSTDGGVFYTNGATSAVPVFQQRNKNLSNLQFYTCDVDQSGFSNDMAGGLQDNGSLLWQGGNLNLNSMMSGGDGAYCFFDADEAGMLITSTYYNVYYVFSGGSFLNYIDGYQSGLFVNPTDYDSKHNTLYANACNPFADTHVDELLRITEVEGLADGQFLPLGTGTTVPYSHVKVSPHSTLFNTKLFIGTESGRLFRVTNANTTPVVNEITGSSFPAAAISCVAVGGSEDTLLVTFSNYGVTSVWQTYNGGSSWQNIEANLPDMPVRWAIYHPQSSRQALLATETGIWTSSTLTQSAPFWVPANTGYANVRTDMLKIRASDKKVVAASHGRGLFYGTFNVDGTTTLPEPAVPELALHVWPNPGKGRFQIELPQQENEVRVNLFTLSGMHVYSEKIHPDQENIIPLDLTTLHPGIYLLEVYSSGKKMIQKVEIVR